MTVTIGRWELLAALGGVAAAWLLAAAEETADHRVHGSEHAFGRQRMGRPFRAATA